MQISIELNIGIDKLLVSIKCVEKRFAAIAFEFVLAEDKHSLINQHRMQGLYTQRNVFLIRFKLKRMCS